MPDLIYQLITKENLVAVLPSDHRLAALDEVDPRDLAGETFITVSNTAPTLQVVIDEFILRLGRNIRPSHQVDNIAMAMSMVASTRGISLLPAYAENFLPRSVVSRPLAGDPPTIDLVIGYSRTNTSPLLKLFLSRIDGLISRCRPRTAQLTSDSRPSRHGRA
jgi:LysR family hca operon transcriptional activator